MNDYLLFRVRDRRLLKHCGERYYRVYELWINGQLYKTFMEGDSDVNYYEGKHFDKTVLDFINHVRQFFPGTLRRGGFKDTNWRPET